MSNTPSLTHNNEIRKTIVKRAIRSALCVDDQYNAPYENLKKFNSLAPQDLYYSFRKFGECDLDIYRYKGLREWNKHKFLLKNKDLLILDWELRMLGAAPKYQQTLKILKDLYSTKGIPFIVIYTNTPDISEVGKNLILHFNQFDKRDYEQLINKIIEKFKNLSEELKDEDEDERIDIVENTLTTCYPFFSDYVLYPNEREKIQPLIYTHFKTNLLLADTCNQDKFNKKLNGLTLELYPNFNNNDPFEILAQIVMCRNEEPGKTKFKISRIDVQDQCYSVNGVLTLIVPKSDHHGGGISANDLFDKFSSVITNNPHSIINLLGLELKDSFRENFSQIGTEFNGIDEQAFLYHAKSYIEKNEVTNETIFRKGALKNFIVRSWLHELLQHSLDEKLAAIDLVEEEITKQSQNTNLENSLIRYAALVSTVSLRNRENHKLGFGDLFKAEDRYFLCITPHCDCFEPSKINDQFYFIPSTKNRTSNKNALENAEQGYFSFVIEESHPRTIEWECKPFTSHVPEKINSSTRKNILFEGKKVMIKFICTIKENYAQRIANNSFGHGYRVGIDLPKIKSKK